MPSSWIHVSGYEPVPVHTFRALVIGSGAAGVNCAEHLFHLYQSKGIEGDSQPIALVTAGLYSGTSACSGSDKQTYYRLGVEGSNSDSPIAMARTLAASGCMHGDIARAEAEGSLREFYHLVENGVPFPQNELGGFVSYQTDHDHQRRATSAGPWTSRFMVRQSVARLEQQGVPIFNGYKVIGLITSREQESPRCHGVIAVHLQQANQPSLGLVVLAADEVIMATGGPGDMYATSVYPYHQMGTHGLLFENEVIAQNLTESQFGLASLKPKWNLSGSYQQVIPQYYSTNTNGGDPRDFLSEVFTDPIALANSIFLKGYQWPFDPTKVANHGSSLIDVLVFHEIVEKQRLVWMDFRKRSACPARLQSVAVSELGSEARHYLERAHAIQSDPLARLAHLNPEAINLYQSRHIDLSREPLPIGVCAQHNNGGFVVDRWWESSMRNLFIIGEQAGTHGVNRPGGAALNAGQVGGLRAAQQITNRIPKVPLSTNEFHQLAYPQLSDMLERIKALFFHSTQSSLSYQQAREQIRQRMTQSAGMVRRTDTIRSATSSAQQLWGQTLDHGLAFQSQRQFVLALDTQYMALTSYVFLAAIENYINHGGGSRGSYLVTSPSGAILHNQFGDSYRSLPDRPEHQQEIIEVWFEQRNQTVQFRPVPVRPIPIEESWFENIWAQFRTGDIFMTKDKNNG